MSQSLNIVYSSIKTTWTKCDNSFFCSSDEGRNTTGGNQDGTTLIRIVIFLRWITSNNHLLYITIAIVALFVTVIVIVRLIFNKRMKHCTLYDGVTTVEI